MLTTPIAVVGMACRYPDAAHPTELWNNVLSGRRAFRRIPTERLSSADYLATGNDDPDRTYATHAALIEGYEFDRLRYRISAQAYQQADTVHWLALDVAAQAIENAGFGSGGALPRDTTAVIVGNTLTGEFSRANSLRLRWPYVRRTVDRRLAAVGWDEPARGAFLGDLEREFKAPFESVGTESLAGALSNTIAGRICNHYDLHGGGYAVDGACAASLLAVTTGCSGLVAGDVDVVVAGGVDLSLDPFELVGFARLGALARSMMRVYDRRSEGFWPGEGCGFVVLTRLDDAVALGMRPYAVIRGWGISSDGSGGITRPEPQGQLMALERAYARAGYGSDSVGYFEGHGTGTPVGDRVEVEALLKVRGAGTTLVPAVLGSVKAIIGHTKAAAGVAGLIKAATAVHTQVLPPTTGCEEPLDELRGGHRLAISAEPRTWPSELPLRASVSAFGFGGINTHVTLEGLAADRRRVCLSRAEVQATYTAQDAELFCFSAATFAELNAVIDRLAVIAPSLSLGELGDAAAATAVTADSGALRGAVVARSVDELSLRLHALGEAAREERAVGRVARGVHLALAGSPRIGFLFPGQASPAPRDGGALGRRFRASAEIYRDAALGAGSTEVDTAAVQPAIVTGSVAALRVLSELGVEADVSLGHSLGELTAYHWAGVLTWPELLGTARARGTAMAAVPGEGAMLSVAAPAHVVEPLLPKGVVIACLNSPTQTIAAGEPAALELLAKRAATASIGHSRLAVSHAFHSGQMRPATDGLGRQLDVVTLRTPARTVVSSITGARLEASTDLRRLLLDQLTSPVHFQAALESMRGEVDLLVEVGPGHVLSRLAEEVLGMPVYTVDAGGDSLGGPLEFLAAAFVAGAPFDTARLFQGRRLKALDLDRRLRFFINPCESRPDAAEAPAPIANTRTDDARQAAGTIEPLEVVRELVCARTELPGSAVRAEDRFLSDLHLNSITVAQLLVEAASRLGVQPPRTGLDFADASLEEAATALANLPPKTADESAGEPAGAVDWIRLFGVELVAEELPADPTAASPAGWTLEGPADHPLRRALEPILGELAGTGTLVVVAGESPGTVFECLLAAARAADVGPVVFVQEAGGPSAGGFAKTLCLESPGSAIKVVQVPTGDDRVAAWVRAETSTPADFAEIVYDSAGRRWLPVLRALDATEPGAFPLAPEDVLLVSGGGKGIGAEAALALGRAVRCRVALLGRADPNTDSELATNLVRFAASGVDCRYLRADLTNPDAVARAIAEIGPVTALIHAAGINEPRLLKDLSPDAAATVIATKCDGLENLLTALDPARLRLLIGFGSVIARSGLPGEAHYAFANDWMRWQIERHGVQNPGCRSVCLEWSVWSGVGMGERLQTVQTLRGIGVTPISVERGVGALIETLASDIARSSIVVTGRLGGLRTARFDQVQPPFFRFLESVRAWYPGVELVADSEVSLATDAYLQHHKFAGEMLLPAVMGLEAMAEAVGAVAVAAEAVCFEQVAFSQPITIDRNRVCRIRVAATAAEPGVCDIALRSDATGFQIDHFRARVRNGKAPEPILLPATSTEQQVEVDPDLDLYGSMFFQGGPFRRLLGYTDLRAFSCSAEISGADPGGWFARYLPADLMLGDPGARDAALHSLQACLPGLTVLPVEVEEIRIQRGSRDGGTLQLRAAERESNGDTFTWDLELRDSTGALIETWRGLILKRVEERQLRSDWPPALLTATLERRFAEALGAKLRIELMRGAMRGSPWRHRPDGKPDPHSEHSSAAYAADLALVVASDDPVACDLEVVEGRPPDLWGALLGRARFALATTIAQQGHEALDVASTRAWSAAEALKKLGHEGQPLVLERARNAGLVSFRAGAARVETLLFPAAGKTPALVATVACLDGHA